MIITFCWAPSTIASPYILCKQPPLTSPTLIARRWPPRPLSITNVPATDPPAAAAGIDAISSRDRWSRSVCMDMRRVSSMMRCLVMRRMPLMDHRSESVLQNHWLIEAHLTTPDARVCAFQTADASEASPSSSIGALWYFGPSHGCALDKNWWRGSWISSYGCRRTHWPITTISGVWICSWHMNNRALCSTAWRITRVCMSVIGFLEDRHGSCTAASFVLIFKGLWTKTHFELLLGSGGSVDGCRRRRVRGGVREVICRRIDLLEWSERGFVSTFKEI